MCRLAPGAPQKRNAFRFRAPGPLIAPGSFEQKKKRPNIVCAALLREHHKTNMFLSRPGRCESPRIVREKTAKRCLRRVAPGAPQKRKYTLLSGPGRCESHEPTNPADAAAATARETEETERQRRQSERGDRGDETERRRRRNKGYIASTTMRLRTPQCAHPFPFLLLLLLLLRSQFGSSVLVLSGIQMDTAEPRPEGEKILQPHPGRAAATLSAREGHFHILPARATSISSAAWRTSVY